MSVGGTDTMEQGWSIIYNPFITGLYHVHKKFSYWFSFSSLVKYEIGDFSYLLVLQSTGFSLLDFDLSL